MSGKPVHHRADQDVAERRYAIDRWLNRLAPGAGLALLGYGATGVTLCAGFAVACHLTLSLWLGPGGGRASLAAGAIPLTAVAFWLLSQRMFESAVREQRAADRSTNRRNALAAARQELRRGDGPAARRALEPLLNDLDSDLSIAVHYARALSLCDPSEAAGAAWNRVRRLDRHRIYADLTDEAAGVRTRQNPGKAAGEQAS